MQTTSPHPHPPSSFPPHHPAHSDVILNSTGFFCSAFVFLFSPFFDFLLINCRTMLRYLLSFHFISTRRNVVIDMAVLRLALWRRPPCVFVYVCVCVCVCVKQSGGRGHLPGPCCDHLCRFVSLFAVINTGP